jgi:hypothetical protein
MTNSTCSSVIVRGAPGAAAALQCVPERLESVGQEPRLSLAHRVPRYRQVTSHIGDR